MIVGIQEIKKLSKIKNSFYDDLKIEFLYHSNHLEGSTFSKENLAQLLNKRKVEGSHFYDDVIETQNSLEVFDKVINTMSEELNRFLLFDWHRTLKKGSIDDEIHNIGKWKQYENRLSHVGLKTALPHEVDGLIYNLLMNWREKEDKSIYDIAYFHAEFEKIHPFQDGNGRIGRFIILKQCIVEKIDLIAIDQEYDTEYKKALYEAQTVNDVTGLVNVFEKCQLRLDQKMSIYKNTIETVKREFSNAVEESAILKTEDDFENRDI